MLGGYWVTNIDCRGDVNYILRNAFNQIGDLLQTPRDNDKTYVEPGTFRILTDRATVMFEMNPRRRGNVSELDRPRRSRRFRRR